MAPKARSSFSRRRFLRSGAGAGVVACLPVLETLGATRLSPVGGRGASRRAYSLDRDWLFLGKVSSEARGSGFADQVSSSVTLPHCVTPLSWQEWDPAAWQDVFEYRRDFDLPPQLSGLRVFLHFDRVMDRAVPVLNGHALPEHLGGFLPFEYEVTDLVKEQRNTLSLAVDSRWSNIPPAGSPRGPASVDYLLPGGVCGSVELRAVPLVFLKEVFAKPVNVLTPQRRLEISCKIDCAIALPANIRLVATLHDSGRVVDSTAVTVRLTRRSQDIDLTLNHLKSARLWNVDAPHLYDLEVTLFSGDSPLHTFRTRGGFREARFGLDGFFLNGERLQLFGLNRHELYPYVGFAAPNRALRWDAHYLRHHLNCNIVRCSHYPQSEAFLDACDELGMLVWEEIPGWQYIGDESWQNIALRNVEDMVRRDRNHPSIVIWGVRINESANDPELYRRTRELARSLDDSRPTSGTMTPSSTKDWREQWHQDVFAFDDYHAESDGSVGIAAPLPGVPYMVAEAVGQYAYGTAKNFSRKYRRAGDAGEQAEQALLHAQAHSRGAANPRCCGVIAWCAFDYASLLNAYAGLKCPGVADTFRVPKLGASFYLAQVNPAVRVVIEPSFYWDFGPHTPGGPGKRSAIFSNCESLQVFLGGRPHAVLKPDREAFPNLKHPPFFVDLDIDGSSKPELRIDGYIGGDRVLSRSFSSDSSTDRLSLQADDAEIRADGSDATRVVFAAVDRFGGARPFVEGDVTIKVEGPGVIVGDSPFAFAASGGVGAVWVKSLPGHTGQMTVTASHSSLGRRSLTVHSKDAPD